MEPLHLLENSTTLQKLQRYLCIGTFVHNIVCLTIFSYNIFISNRSRSIHRIEWISLFTLLTILIFSCSILCILYPFNSTQTACIYIVTFSTIAYSLSKLSLYNFFLERLFIITNKASIQTDTFSTRNIKIWRIALYLWALFISSLFITFGHNAYFSQNQQFCFSKYPPFVLGIVSLGDLIISLSISILLCRALLFAIHQNCGDQQIQNEYILLKKFVLLSVIAVITTQLSLIVTIVLSFGTLWTSLDSVINVWCILLSFGHSQKLNKVYNAICGRMHACFGWNQCLLCFACNCWCAVVQVPRTRTIHSESNVIEETRPSSITGDTTTTDGTVTIVQPPKLRQSITKMDISTTTNSNSIQLRIQSTIQLSIGNDGSANVKSVDVETNLTT